MTSTRSTSDCCRCWCTGLITLPGPSRPAPICPGTPPGSTIGPLSPRTNEQGLDYVSMYFDSDLCCNFITNRVRKNPNSRDSFDFTRSDDPQLDRSFGSTYLESIQFSGEFFERDSRVLVSWRKKKRRTCIQVDRRRKRGCWWIIPRLSSLAIRLIDEIV